MSIYLSLLRNLITKLDFVLLLLGVLLASFSPILIRLSETEISPHAVIFDRYWIAAIVLGIYYAIKAIPWSSSDRLSEFKVSYTLKDIALLFLVAVFNLACLTSWAWSLTQTSVSNSNLLHNTTPIFATLGGWLFLQHRFNGKFLMGIALALTGTVVIGIIDTQGAMDAHINGDALALLSAIFYAGGYLITEPLRTKFSATTILLWSCALGSLLMLPFMLFGGERIFPYSGFGWLTVISQTILCQIMGIGIVLHSLKKFSSAFVFLILLLDPVIAALLASAIFAEQLSIFNWLAFGLILTGIYLAKSGQGAEKSDDELVVVQDN